MAKAHWESFRAVKAVREREGAGSERERGRRARERKTLYPSATQVQCRSMKKLKRRQNLSPFRRCSSLSLAPLSP
ncbi:hypothetical protein CEXT_106461 [Caerostris extrusa]|uniref:Uncharacterized protein n=1 Tax=Caerostris extrusa TaxID=172846 RepID=A0AAV4VXV6_CAEEX|nr:hypothetical protein CEXT_106461 [Caerostris extrusa]